MITFTTKKDIRNYLESLPDKGSVGFVPTMGALHQGHISLLNRSKEENEISIVSIFVNPTQFNDINDFHTYPKNFAEDSEILEQQGCNILFLPSYGEIYPEKAINWIDVDLGDLEKVMEGSFRPGHFKGVKTVVYKLFDIIEPDKAYFGIKDYQQLLVIKKMVEKFKMPVQIVPCATKREPDGLAMSSRNKKLNREERTAASEIPLILNKSLEKLSFMAIHEIKQLAQERFNKHPLLQLQYFEILNQDTLLPAEKAKPGNTRIFIAAFAGKTRLIDNMLYE